MPVPRGVGKTMKDKRAKKSRKPKAPLVRTGCVGGDCRDPSHALWDFLAGMPKKRVRGLP